MVYRCCHLILVDVDGTVCNVTFECLKSLVCVSTDAGVAQAVEPACHRPSSPIGSSATADELNAEHRVEHGRIGRASR